MGIVFANREIVHMMTKRDVFKAHTCIEVPMNSEVDPRVSNHTDLSVFVSDAIYVAPCIFEAFRTQWQNKVESTSQEGRDIYADMQIICGTSVLKQDYPNDIAFNAVKLENHFFHKLAYTEPKILSAMYCEKIDVNQGYTRCSTMVLNNKAVITEDHGLAKVYARVGYDVLLIDKGFVSLAGFDYGFFGGSGGVLEDMLVLNGALKHHPNGAAITNFVHRHGLRIVELHAGPLVDCGSILFYGPNNAGVSFQI